MQQNYRHEQFERYRRDVNETCDSNVLDGMQLPDLAARAAVSEHCSIVATGIFTRKFTASAIRIGNVLPTDYDADTGANILRQFGPLIPKLSLNFDYHPAMCGSATQMRQHNKLFNYINQYCRDSLIEFHINFHNCDVNIFRVMTGPFVKTEMISINASQSTLETNARRLNETLPRVRQLNLNFKGLTEPNFLDCEYRDLDELIIANGVLDDSFEATFKGLLKKNTRIRFVSVVSPRTRTIHLINKHLKQLEELHIRQSIREDSQAESIFFANLKRLDIQLAVGECDLPNKINFARDALEELSVECAHHNIDNNYFEFILKNSHIKKLSAGIELNKDMLENKLTGRFRYLRKASMSFNEDVHAETIAKFVRRSKQLNELRFTHTKINNPHRFMKQLQEILGGDFKVRYARITYEYVIERTIPDGAVTTHFSSNAIALFILLYIGRVFLF